MRVLFVLLIVVLLTACAGRPVVMRGYDKDPVSEIGVYSTDSTRRVIMANLDDGTFCAEPPPETQLETSSSFRLLLEAAIDTDSDTARVEAFRSLSVVANQLYKRSHSVQLYRDASYYLCQAYLNGAINTDYSVVKADLDRLKADLEERSTQLLELKIDGSGQELASLASSMSSLVQRVDSIEAKLEIPENLKKDAYMTAQVHLAMVAFSSLGEEVEEFYDSELKIEEGKNQALTKELRGLIKSSKELGDAVDSLKKSVEQNSKDIADLDSDSEK